MVYDVKHDLRRKARLVAGGHKTEVPRDSTYSSVVSLRSMRIVMFLTELNEFDLCAGDISSAYLYAYTSEQVYAIAGWEFGELEGN